VPNHIARDPTLPDKAFRLWIVLETYTKADDPSSWPSINTLAQLMGCSRNTIVRASADLVERGLLEIHSGKESGESNTYVLVDPLDEQGGYATRGLPPDPPMGHRGNPPMGHKPKPVEPQPGNHLPAPAAPRATDDPLVAHAHKLTVLAFEQPIKPVLRENGKGAFPAVLSLIEKQLRAGSSVQAIERAIKAGVEVWTQAGLQTSIARANPRPLRSAPGRIGATTDQSLSELRSSIAATEKGNPP
jgi:hypothetical protein